MSCNIFKSGWLCPEKQTKKSEVKVYIITFDEELANEVETCELVNNEKDDQMGTLVKKWNVLSNFNC